MAERCKPTVPTVASIIAIVVIALGVYAGAYYWSVSNADGFDVDESQTQLIPRYPYGGAAANFVFYPAHFIDRQLRPAAWQYDGYDYEYDEYYEEYFEPGPEFKLSLDAAKQAADVNGPDPYDAQIIAGSKAHVTGDIEAAVVEFTQAIEANPDGYDAYLNRGVAHQELGNWSEALADFERARDLNPDDPAAWNNIAMLLASCPDDEVRNGPKAAEYAQKACELTQWKHPAVLNTLAIAYAELGDWQAATDICDQELGKLGDDPLANEFRLLLELFKQEKPYRMAATKGE